MEIEATDYHTAGEPFRIVREGALEIPGATVGARREYAAGSEEIEHVRRLLCHEPRGHADMYGGFLVPADDDGADFGVLFWHKDGYSTACGHGTIALGAWAVESGRVAGPDDGDVHVTIDVPSGAGHGRRPDDGGAVTSVAFRNVPSYVVARDVPAAGAAVDVAFGGAIYAFAPAARFGLRVEPEALPELIELGRSIKRELDGTEVARHSADERLSGIYGTVLYDELAPLHQRTVAIFADGEVDRSPTGSATSARTALLVTDGALAEGRRGAPIRSSARRFTRVRSARRTMGSSPRSSDRVSHRRASLRPRSARPARDGLRAAMSSHAAHRSAGIGCTALDGSRAPDAAWDPSEIASASDTGTASATRTLANCETPPMINGPSTEPM